MNQYVVSLLLGIIEGLTEFLPVSSTAHLRIAESLLGINLADGFWKMFTIVIQLGAILCLPIYFSERIFRFLGTFPRGERGERTLFNHPLSLVLLAFVFTAVPSLLMTKIIGKHLESLYVMAGALVIGGLVMWAVDALYDAGKFAMKPMDHMEDMSAGQAVWIGLCQTLSAIFPGTSRSMATIAAGQFVGMSRSAALEFSFFLSIPTMCAATAYDLYKSVHPHHGEASALGAVHMTPALWVNLGIGFVVSFIVAYAVIAWFMNWVRSRGFVPFAIYRILAGLGVLWVAMHR